MRTTAEVVRTSKEEVAAIRKAIKAQVPTVSVRRGRGTAYSWIEVSGSEKWGEFTDAERAGLKALGFNTGGNFAVISPDSRKFWIEKLGIGKPNKTERCTVHASPDCLDPDGPTFHGRGWDHDGSDPRIECSACTKVMTA